VTVFDGQLAELAQIMIEVMTVSEGVGLAANQINVDQRIFVYGIDEPFTLEGEYIQAIPAQAIVNPIVTVVDPATKTLEEGCLSIPGLNGPVSRPIKIRLDGFNVVGQPLTKEVSGYEARVIQHEVDHLNGKLFLDYITDPRLIRMVTHDDE
jgi:peptide deformylase